MPFVRNVFIVGALALAGVPILNGFWSKELILEVGLEHSPIWAYGIMLVGAGLTAYYTLRMVWLVFFGGLNGLLSTTLPFHEIEHESTLELVTTILSAPATWFALVIVALGFGISWIHMKGLRYFGGGWLQPFVDTSFGFESINHFVVRIVSKFAERLRTTQTGELNWNILGIVSGLLLVLLVLWMGA
jgi:NADH-quinone oxidoreductase subunit L